MLQKEEFSKSRAFELLANSGGASAPKRRRKCVDKAHKIATASEELRAGRITASTFINRMVFPKNETVTEMEPDDDLFEDISYLEEEDEEESDPNDDASKAPAKALLLCVVCLVREPNILLLPCKHLKICSECLLKLQADSLANDEEHYKCPVCRDLVNDTMQVFL